MHSIVHNVELGAGTRSPGGKHPTYELVSVVSHHGAPRTRDEAQATNSRGEALPAEQWDGGACWATALTRGKPCAAECPRQGWQGLKDVSASRSAQDKLGHFGECLEHFCALWVCVVHFW